LATFLYHVTVNAEDQVRIFGIAAMGTRGVDREHIFADCGKSHLAWASFRGAGPPKEDRRPKGAAEGFERDIVPDV
jgi:hypothetical protein